MSFTLCLLKIKKRSWACSPNRFDLFSGLSLPRCKKGRPKHRSLPLRQE